MNFILKNRHWVLYLVVFTLPMYMRVNNILLAAFIALGILNILFVTKKLNWNVVARSWPVMVFFLLAVAGSFYDTTFSNGFKLLERYWAFLLVPLVLLAEKDYYKEKRDGIFLALAWGSAATLLICYGNLIYEMVARQEPLEYFFRWRHIGYQFTAVADTDPTYLGLFIVTSIIFLFQYKRMNVNVKFAVMVFLLFGLFQLASRISLFLAVLFVVVLLFGNARKHLRQTLLLMVVIAVGVLVYNRLGSDYVKDRLFTIETMLDDKRFQRWEASYEIFVENPFIGVGFSKIESVRDEKYIKYGFEIAARKDLNAHNQFLELLSRNGFIGGFVYVCSIGFLLLLSIYKRDFLFTLIFFVFIVANLTESTLVRIKGIEYFAIFASLFLCGIDHKNRSTSENIHHP